MRVSFRRPASGTVRGICLLLILFAGSGFAGCSRNPPEQSGLKLEQFADLAGRGVRIGIVDPDLGPAGRYARQALARYARVAPQSAAAIEKNIVTYESHVRALLDKLLQHEIDAAFVYRSDTRKKNQLKVIVLPAACAVVPEYALARLKESRVPDLAAAFIDWLVRPDAVPVWREYGFQPRFPGVAETGPGTQTFTAAARHLQGTQLTVFAAAVFYDVLPVFARSFKKATGVDVTCEFAGSGRLYRKLLQGAVGKFGADLFLSAAPRYVDDLVAHGRADRARVFMGNELVVAVSRLK